jgi:WD40 repeat protein
VLVSMVVTFALWLRARRRSRRRAAPPSGLLPTAALTADGQGVAVIEASGAVAVLDPDNGAPKHRLTADGGVPMGIVALGGGRCATLGADGQLRVHDAAGAIAHRSSQPRATCMGGAPGGSLIAFGTADHKVRVVGQDGKERCTLAGHTDAVTAVAIARDQQQLVSGGADHAVRLWSLASSSCEHVLSGATATITAVALGGNGRFVAAGCADGNSVVWDARHQKLLHVVRTGNGPVRALAFAPDAALLFAAGADRAIHCIDAASGQVLGRVAGLAAPAVVLAISNDGARIVSADTDGQVVAWMRRARPSGVKTPQLQSAGAP